jgi:type I restriction enzyme R subunit
MKNLHTSSRQDALDEELKRLRAEIAAAKKASTTQPDTHDYSEAQTRDIFIDLLLKEAGWALDHPAIASLKLQGMPNASGKGFTVTLNCHSIDDMTTLHNRLHIT